MRVIAGSVTAAVHVTFEAWWWVGIPIGLVVALLFLWALKPWKL